MMPWNDKTFKKLQREWDLKLKESGLKDAEKTNKNGYRSLITSSNPFRDYPHTEVAEAKALYFSQMSSKAQQYEWSDIQHYYILSKHAEGKRAKDIIKDLTRMGCKGYTHRVSIARKIRKYEKMWGVKSWNKLPIK